MLQNFFAKGFCLAFSEVYIFWMRFSCVLYCSSLPTDFRGPGRAFDLTCLCAWTMLN